MVKVPAGMGVRFRGMLPPRLTSKGFTVRVTALLVTLPAALVTVTVMLLPESVSRGSARVKVEALLPTLVPFCCQR